MSYFKEIFQGAWSLVEGMKVTFRRLFHPLVTVQYPRKRIEMSPAYRGHIELVFDPETHLHKCIACGTCQKTCPSGVISVQGAKTGAKGPKSVTGFEIDYNKCSLCGLCVECCPVNAIAYSREYQLAGASRDVGVIDLMRRAELQGAVAKSPVPVPSNTQEANCGEQAA